MTGTGHQPTTPDDLVPTSSRPRPENRDDLRNRARPSSPSPTGDELELESSHHPVENPNHLVLGTTSGTRSCRTCGCTDDNACIDPDYGPCWWIEPDLCSHCPGATR